MSNALYTPLDLVSDEIRLLALQPGEGTSVVRAVLIYVSLSNVPEYEALSYAWGDPKITKSIQIGVVSADKKFSAISEMQVTTNLESVLRHLRFKDKPRILWADAICINQNDFLEKNSQVRRMGSIYRKSSHVCFWIGEEADDSDVAMDLIEYHSSGNRKEEEALSIDLRWAAAFKALTHLVCRPWFTRRWIVQEILLSGNSVVYCGTKSTSWRSLLRASRSLEFEISNLLVHRTGDGTIQLPTSHVFSKLDVSDQRIEIWRQGLKNISEIYQAQLVVTRDPSPPLTTLLRTLQRKAVTDPRDAIYALLSLSNEGQLSQINIDYSMPVMEVFLDTAKVIILKYNSLDIICLSFGFAECGHSDSWIPRFSIIDEECHCRVGQDLPNEGKLTQSKSAYSASGSSKPVLKFQSRKLVAKGILVDRIQVKLEDETPEKRWTHIPKLWKDTALSLSSLCVGGTDSKNAVFTADPAILFDAFWRTLVCNRTRVKMVRKPPQSWGHWFQTWIESDMILKWLFTEDEDIQSQTDEIHVAMRRSVAHRRFIITEMKRIGLAPKYAKQGDIVCVLLGCSVPVILRPASKPGLYHFIGDSYIHGIMDGEVITSSEKGDFIVEEFSII